MILRHIWISIEGPFTEMAVVPIRVVSAVITHSVSFGCIIGAAIRMIITLTGCKKIINLIKINNEVDLLVS